MRLVKCDRCGRLDESMNRVLIYFNSTTNSDKQAEKDLCEVCEKVLLKVLDPVHGKGGSE